MAKATPLEIRQNLSLELRRGALVLAVLAGLEQEQYGYSLKNDLAEKGIDIDEGTLYPLLRRLESQGLLESKWVLSDARPRRYYQLNREGARILRELSAEWRLIARSLDKLLRRLEAWT
jgi:DNA-binding PadR family transcriptional regulator